MLAWKQQQITSSGNQTLATFSIGSGPSTLLLIHGGPGTSSLTLRDSHHRYATELGMRVVTWDQLGCGESLCDNDDSLWTIARFVQECVDVIEALQLTNIHLVGRSWGGIIAIEYALQHHPQLKSLVLGSTTCHAPLMQRGFERCKMALGMETYQMMAKREATGTADHPEYQAALTLLMYRHLCRMEQWPEALKSKPSVTAKRSMEKIFGKHLFNCNGELRTYDRSDRLPEITIPTLVMHGEFDYIPLDCALLAKSLLPQSELAVLNNCSHLAYYEDPEQYHRVLMDFLKRQLRLAISNGNAQ